MGYTHYFEVHKDGIPAPTWKAICEDVKKLLANLPKHSTNAGGYQSGDPLEIAYESDQPDKPPLISSAQIRFNGKDGGADLGHETFLLERKPKREGWNTSDGPLIFRFCKTARKPYDLPVCGVLILASAHAGDLLKVSSDGDLSDWIPALEWVADLFPDPIYSGKFDGLSRLFELGQAAPPDMKSLGEFVKWARVTARLDLAPEEAEAVAE